MTVKWSKNSKNDIKDCKRNSDRTNNNVEKYISKLMDYTDMLSIHSSLGVFVLQKRNYQIRQLIFRQHRIFYSVYSNIVFIISIVHIHRDIESYLNYFKEILV